MPRLISILVSLSCVWSITPAFSQSVDFDGVVVECDGERLQVKLKEEATAQVGDVVLLYRYYPNVPDPVGARHLSGHTLLGRARLVELSGLSAVVLSPLVDVEVGDQVEFVDAAIASTVAGSAWVAQGKEKERIGEPFLVPRELGNRIQLTNDFVRLSKPDETGTGDFYVGTTLDFTFWPQASDGALQKLESLRFGAGGVQGENSYAAELSPSGDPLVRFLFGFAEVDYTPAPMFGLIPSLKLGLNNSGFGAGVGLKLRLGTPQNGHMIVGGEYTSGVGGKASFEFHHFPTEITQVWLGTSIENLPAGGPRWGSRIQLGVEHRLTEHWWMFGAVGISGRRALGGGEDQGPSGLLGVSYNFDTPQ